MAASAKGAITQLGRVWTETESTRTPILLDGSLLPMASASVPPELRDLSRLMPIVVLVPRSTMHEQGSMQQTSLNTRAAHIEDPSDSSSPMQAAMIRFHSANSEDVAIFGEVSVSFSTMETCRTGREVVLTRKEFRMLEYLIKNPRRVISRDELLNRVWGYDSYPCTRTVDNHILRLRRKLEQEPSEPRHFLTVHGAGYKFLP
jgi:DNA-binding response OmpR family regulator